MTIHPTPPAVAVPLRVGVIGTGQRASIALHVAEAATEAMLVAAVDVTEEGRARAAEIFGKTIAIYSSHADFIAHGGIDAAIVTTPDWTHAAIAIDLLRAGIAVYLEKPIAISLTDSDAILSAAYETQTPLYVGHNFRHSAVVRLMREIIERGEIGQVKTIWCRHFVGTAVTTTSRIGTPTGRESTRSCCKRPAMTSTSSTCSEVATPAGSSGWVN